MSGTLLTELIQRGGDALYSLVRRGVGDVETNLNEMRDNVRRWIRTPGDGARFDTSEITQTVHNAVERVLRVADLPTRGDLEALNKNLERLASALESFEARLAVADTERPRDRRSREPTRDGRRPRTPAAAPASDAQRRAQRAAGERSQTSARAQRDDRKQERPQPERALGRQRGDGRRRHPGGVGRCQVRQGARCAREPAPAACPSRTSRSRIASGSSGGAPFASLMPWIASTSPATIAEPADEPPKFDW